MPLTIANFIRKPGAGGKFVVLRPRGDEDDGIVLFSDFTRDFQRRDIVDRWERGNGSLARRGMTVAGGGWWKYEGMDFLIVYGQSAAYGRFDPAWLRPRLRPGMVGAETRIDVR